MRRVACFAAFLLPLGLASAQGPGNVLLVVADDLGVYELACYGEGTDPAVTPTIDGLAANGVTFRNCWSSPFCSPTRATLLTGRYPHHTGVGTLVTLGWTMQRSEMTIAEQLKGLHVPYSTGFFGKWHVSTKEAGDLVPNEEGFDRAVWTRDNLNPPKDSYHRWDQIEDGVVVSKLGYITVDTVDEALDFIATAPEPWFVQVSFHAPHHPFHVPPAGLYTTDVTTATPEYQRPLFKAMIESLDHELGRLLDELAAQDKTANVIFLGDNGSPNLMIGPPGQFEKAKGTLYEGGINVPLIVSGPSVPAAGRTCDALVGVSDVFSTILDFAGGVPAGSLPPVLDSISMHPYLNEPDLPSLRGYAYAEFFSPTGFAPDTYLCAVRGRRYKLMIALPELSLQFFDLNLDPSESVNLLAAPLSPPAQSAYNELLAAAVAETMTFGP